MLILTLPVDSQAYQEFLKSFLWWSCYQASLYIALASRQYRTLRLWCGPEWPHILACQARYRVFNERALCSAGH